MEDDLEGVACHLRQFGTLGRLLLVFPGYTLREGEASRAEELLDFALT